MSASAAFSLAVPAQAGERTVRLRLTRRGRFVVGSLVTLLAAAFLAAAAMLGAPQAQASVSDGAHEFSYVVVAPGASLWSVASGLDSAGDPRDLVAEIVRLNQLEGSSVQAGQAIAVPLRFSDAPGTVPASDLGIDLAG